MRQDTLAILLGTVALALGAAGPATAHDRTLLASWSFDAIGQIAADATGNGNDGRLGASDGPDTRDPVFVDGIRGHALAFDGNAYVRVPDTPRLEPQRVTVSAWVRRWGSPGRYRYVLSKGAQRCDRSGYGLYSAANGGLGFYVSSASEHYVSPLAAPASVWDGAWHHVAGVYDGTKVRLFVDGVQVQTGAPAPPAIAYGVGHRGVYIGVYHGTCELPFAGDIDEVRVWGLAKSSEDIAGDADRGRGTTGANPSGQQLSQPQGQSSSTTVRPRACYAVWVNRKALTVRHKAKLRFTVRDRGRLLTGVRLRIRGAGVRATVMTRRAGRVNVVVRPRWRNKVTISVVGQPRSCPKPTIRVRRR